MYEVVDNTYVYRQDNWETKLIIGLPKFLL